MRRAVIVIVVGVLGALAFAQTGPVDVRPPEFGTLPPEVGTATGDPSAWYCPWVAAGALRDSAFGLASMVDVDASITIPDSNPTEEPTVEEARLRGPGARSIDAGDIVRRGTSPGVVEFDDGPAVATTATWSDEILTGDRCVVSVPKVWHLVGGITAQEQGFTLELQLFNPFAENAKVRVETINEFGSSTLAGFESLDIAGRSWVTEDLTRVVAFNDNVSFVVTSETGIVIPSLVLNNGTDEASWPGTGQATNWDFPVTSVPGLVPNLVLSNTGSVGATVAIDLYTPDGPILDADELIVSPLQPIRLNLADLAEPPFAVRVRSNAPIVAVIQAAPEGVLPSTGAVLPEDDVENTEVDTDETTDGGATDGSAGADEATTETTVAAEETAEGEEADEPVTYDGLAAMSGNPDPLERWLVPGLGVVPGADTSIWILNPSGDDATVTLSPLGVSSGASEEILIPAGTYAEVPIAPLSETGSSGMLVEANVPVSVAVTISGPQGVAFIGGVGIG